MSSFVGGKLSFLKIFILAEGLVIWHYQVEGAVWCKVFVNLVYTLTLPIYMIRRFMIHDSEICGKGTSLQH